MKELEMGAAEMWYLFISCSEGFKNESSNNPNEGSNWRSVNQNTLTTYIYIYIYISKCLSLQLKMLRHVGKKAI